MVISKDSMWGNHVLKLDIDSDGEKEILFMGNQGWGATSIDDIRVLKGRDGNNLLLEPYSREDNKAVDFSQKFDLRIKDYAQISYVDFDKDGEKEIVTSFGVPGNASHYVYKCRGGVDLELILVK